VVLRYIRLRRLVDVKFFGRNLNVEFRKHGKTFQSVVNLLCLIILYIIGIVKGKPLIKTEKTYD